ncbi:MAG TPA: hypothetical protein VFQ72_04335 [Candidatus Paceibacterota bacterium]|nr:hypothetical protein [Candidatus Paceibacterota bacterium]
MIALPLALILGIPALATIVLMFVSHETRKTTKEYTAQAWKATSAASKALFVVAIALAAVDVVCWIVGFGWWQARWDFPLAFIITQAMLVVAIAISQVKTPWAKPSAISVAIIAIVGWIAIPHTSKQGMSQHDAAAVEKTVELVPRRFEYAKGTYSAPFILERIREISHSDGSAYVRIAGGEPVEVKAVPVPGTNRNHRELPDYAAGQKVSYMFPDQDFYLVVMVERSP